MPISRVTAMRLCTKPEFELVQASFPASLKHLTPGRLRQKVDRSRKLRDKYRDLARRQRLEARGKRAPQRSRPAQGHENTVRKAELFQEVLDRFEARLSSMHGAPAGAAPSGRRAGAKKTGDTAAPTRQVSGGGPEKPSGGTKRAAAEKKAGAKKAGAKKAGATKASSPAGAAGTGPGERASDASAPQLQRRGGPARTGAAAPRGARSQRLESGSKDAKQQARGKMATGHSRAAGRRTQKGRDSRSD
jgi:hypothetical protein